MPLAYVWGLAISGFIISVIGAYFSVTGLASLFSSATIAIIFMAAGMEFAKFVMAAYLHRAWKRTNILMKTYMSVSVVVLSAITSMGIFGFLSNSFQRSYSSVEVQQIKIQNLKEQSLATDEELVRIRKVIDEIPANRITRKINVTREWNPRMDELREKKAAIAEEMKEMNLKMLDTNEKVGPLVFVSKAFDTNIETIVKYLILIFVGVFDPLAICLVIATSSALKWREEDRMFEGLMPNAAPTVPSSNEITMDYVTPQAAEEDIKKSS